MTDSSARTGNLALDALPADVRDDLLTGASVGSVPAGTVLVHVGDDVHSAFFPTRRTLSMLAEPGDETIVEASSIGLEGAADMFAALGALKVAHRLIGQVPGEVIEIDAKLLAQHVAEAGDPQRLVFGYIQSMYAQAATSAACNAKHTVNQRGARWLLQTHDRVRTDSFELKQEFLAYMLGVSRPSVSLAAETLRNAGLINYTRGVVSIEDREGLESVACSVAAVSILIGHTQRTPDGRARPRSDRNATAVIPPELIHALTGAAGWGTPYLGWPDVRHTHHRPRTDGSAMLPSLARSCSRRSVGPQGFEP